MGNGGAGRVGKTGWWVETVSDSVGRPTTEIQEARLRSWDQGGKIGRQISIR